MLVLVCLSLIAASLAAPTAHVSAVCRRLCPGFAPVCGSNHHTYSNACELAEAACEHRLKGQILYELHGGRCSSIDHHSGHYTCSSICDEEEQQHHICASDGISYENVCRYTMANCAAMKEHHRLHVVTYSAKCPTPKEPDCDHYYKNVSDIALEGPVGSSVLTRCSHIPRHVCTTLGTFNSECDFCATKAEYMQKSMANPNMTLPDFKIWFHGRCGSNIHTSGTKLH